MKTLTETTASKLKEGEFYLSYYNEEALKNELAPISNLKSGLIVISGAVSRGKTHLLQSFVDQKIEQGLKVLVVACQHNEIQNADVVVYKLTNWKQREEEKSKVNTMLERIAAINPDVIIFDSMDYSEPLAMANTLAEQGKLVFAVSRNNNGNEANIAELFNQYPEIEGKDFKDKQDELVSGLIYLDVNFDRSTPRNPDAHIIAKVLKP